MWEERQGGRFPGRGGAETRFAGVSWYRNADGTNLVAKLGVLVIMKPAAVPTVDGGAFCRPLQQVVLQQR